MTIFLYLLITTFLFLIFLIAFYALGKVLIHNTKKEATVKAFIFAVLVFVIYYVIFFLFFGVDQKATTIMITWSAIWFILTYLQAISWWGKIIERKNVE
jgi:hypothetical protein